MEAVVIHPSYDKGFKFSNFIFRDLISVNTVKLLSLIHPNYERVQVSYASSNDESLVEKDVYFLVETTDSLEELSKIKDYKNIFTFGVDLPDNSEETKTEFIDLSSVEFDPTVLEKENIYLRNNDHKLAMRIHCNNKSSFSEQLFKLDEMAKNSDLFDSIRIGEQDLNFEYLNQILSVNNIKYVYFNLMPDKTKLNSIGQILQNRVLSEEVNPALVVDMDIVYLYNLKDSELSVESKNVDLFINYLLSTQNLVGFSIYDNKKAVSKVLPFIFDNLFESGQRLSFLKNYSDFEEIKKHEVYNYLSKKLV